MTTTLNINRLVTVTLTPEGQACLDRHIGDEWASGLGRGSLGLVTHPHAKLNDDQPHEWQLWELMRVFGPGLLNGGPVFFEGNEITLAPPRTADPDPTEEAHDYLIAGAPGVRHTFAKQRSPEQAASGFVTWLGLKPQPECYMVIVCDAKTGEGTKHSVQLTISVRPGT